MRWYSCVSIFVILGQECSHPLGTPLKMSFPLKPPIVTSTPHRWAAQRGAVQRSAVQ